MRKLIQGCFTLMAELLSTHPSEDQETTSKPSLGHGYAFSFARKQFKNHYYLQLLSCINQDYLQNKIHK